jgi:ABC-type proline/glycine betaine transport system ATPase subunit
VCPQPLAQRVFGDEGLKLADEVAVLAAGKVRLQPVLEGPEAQFLEAFRFAD